MNCEQVRKTLSEKLGDITLDGAAKTHIENCADCRNYFEELNLLEAGLKDISVEPMAAVEFAVIQDKLDERINRYLHRATGLYYYTIRYGASLAAVILLLFVSLVSGLYPVNNLADKADRQYTQFLYNDEMAEIEELDEKYLDLVIYDYIQKYGYSTGEMLLGELSADEFEYLTNNIDAGGIL